MYLDILWTQFFIVISKFITSITDSYCKLRIFNACAIQLKNSAILWWRIQDHRSPPVTSLLAVDVATTYLPVHPLRTQHRRWRGIRNWWVLVKTKLATCHGRIYLESQIMYVPYDDKITQNVPNTEIICVIYMKRVVKKYRVLAMTWWCRFRISREQPCNDRAKLNKLVLQYA